LYLDVGADRHHRVYGGFRVRLRFETEAPAGDGIYFGEVIRVHLAGAGQEYVFKGSKKCGEKFCDAMIPRILQTGGLRQVTAWVDVQVQQAHNMHAEFDLWPSGQLEPSRHTVDPSFTQPGHGVELHATSYEPGATGQFYDQFNVPQSPLHFPMMNCMLLARDNRDFEGTLMGGTIQVDVLLTFVKEVYYRHEIYSLNFRPPYYIKVPYVTIETTEV
jgi:hypothetical protein